MKLKITAFLLTVTVLFGICVPAFAQTNEEILFSDNFENSSDFWKTGSMTGSVVNEEPVKFRTNADGECIVKLDRVFKNARIKTDFTAEEYGSNDAFIALYMRYHTNVDSYGVRFYPTAKKLELLKSGTVMETADVNISVAAGEKHSFTLSVKEGIMYSEIDGATIAVKFVGNDISDGNAAFSTSGMSALFENITVSNENRLMHHNFKNGKVFATSATATVQDGVLHFENGNEYLFYDGTWNNNDAFKNQEVTVKLRYPNNQGVMWIRTRAQGSGDAYVLEARNGWNWWLRRNSTWGDATSGEHIVFPDTVSFQTVTVRAVNNSDGSVSLSGIYNGRSVVTKEISKESAFAGGGGIRLAMESGSGNVGEVEEITAVDLSAESGVVYSENGAFENWTIVSGNGSTETGETANRVYRTTAETNGALILSDRSWKNVSVSADIKAAAWAAPSSVLDGYAGVYIRYPDADNNILLGYSPYSQNSGNGTVFAAKTVNGTLSILRSTEVPSLTAGEFHNVVFQAKGRAYRVVIDGKIMCNLLETETDKALCGTIALNTNNQAVDFDNVTVKGERYIFFDSFTRENSVNDTGYQGFTAKSLSGAGYAAENGTIMLKKEDGSALKYMLVFNGDAADYKDTRVNLHANAENWDGLHIKTRALDGDDFHTYVLRTNYSNERYYMTLMYNVGYVLDGGSTNEGQIDVTGELKNSEWARLSVETADNADGSVTVSAYLNGEKKLSFTDYGLPAKWAEHATYADYSGVYPRTLSKGVNGFYIESGLSGTMLADEISLEDMTVSDKTDCTLSFDRDALVSGENVTAAAKVINNSFVKKDASLILALYDADGVLKFATVESRRLDPESEKTITASLTLPSGAENCKLYAFVWDSLNNLTPLCERVTIPAQQ